MQVFSEMLQVLKQAIDSRIQMEYGQQVVAQKPDLSLISVQQSFFSTFVLENKLNFDEVIVILLAFAPHISPNFLTNTVQQYFPKGGDFAEFGGVKGKNHRGILPTGETALYILGGNNVERRIEISRLFGEDHLFARKNVLYLENPGEGEPLMSGRLVLDEEYVELFTVGKVSKPKLSSDFPAELITTEFTWSDLVLQDKTLKEIREIETWLKFNETLLSNWQMRGKIKPGFRVLFYGPPGTGKTMTACLLGKYTARDVFRIDLSMVVSKYIGETEKNLSKLFDKAANKDWILFFDEADSIFGKRTNVRDAHDKYANQEVSYLLQRIESHPGLVILASNLKRNIDTSFVRRFNAMVEFENPDNRERLKLWGNYLPDVVGLDSKINIKEIALKYDLTGANILNVIHYTCLQTLERGSDKISYNDLIKGIYREYTKEGKIFTAD